MTDTFILKGSADMTQAEADVNAFVADQGTFTVKATPEIDETAFDNIGSDLPGIDLPVDVTGTDEAITAIDEIGGAAETNTGKVGGLGGMLGNLGLTSLGLGAAFSAVSTALPVLIGWFDKLGVKADITAAGSQAAADSVFGLFDSLTTLQSATFDTTAGLGALNEAFRAGIDAAHAGDVDKVSESFTALGVNFEDLSQIMLDFQNDEAGATAALAVGAGASQDFADALGEAATHGDSVNDSFRALSADGMRAFGESVGLTGGDLDAYIGKLDDLQAQNALNADQFVNQLPEGLQATGQALVDAAGNIEQVDDAAENTKDTLGHLIDEMKKSPEGAAALAEVQAAMPDASDADVLQALVEKLAAMTPAADDAATALDDVAVDREANITATPEADDARTVLDAAAADRDALIEADADTGAATDAIDGVADADHPTTIEADAETAQAAADLLAETSRSRIAMIIAAAKTSAADSVLTRFKNETRTAVITALAHTGNAEAALNHTARNRTSHITQVVSGSGGGGGSGRAAASATGRAAPAAAAASAGPVYNVSLHAAVIGDRYDVQRVVTRAVRSGVRLGGARTLAGVRG